MFMQYSHMHFFILLIVSFILFVHSRKYCNHKNNLYYVFVPCSFVHRAIYLFIFKSPILILYYNASNILLRNYLDCVRR